MAEGDVEVPTESEVECVLVQQPAEESVAMEEDVVSAEQSGPVSGPATIDTRPSRYNLRQRIVAPDRLNL